METNKPGLAIMTSGGDSAGMNPAVVCAVEYATQRGYKPYLVYDGLKGLIANSIVPASKDLVSGIMHKGGTALRSSRSPEFFDITFRTVAYQNIKSHGIEKLIVIGGDGSFRALNQFYNDFEIPFAGIPATIDNDIAGTDYCLGVDTALNVIRQSIDSIRDTASSFSRAFVVEVMGRHCGYLAVTSALSCGAEVCLVPEIEYNLDTIGARLKAEIAEGRKYIIAVVAEGTKMGEYITRYINDSIGMEARLTVLGHVQRGGSPTVHDRIMAYKFAVAAVDALDAGETNAIMTFKDGTYSHLPIEQVADAKYKLDPALLKLAAPLAC
ncbi:MAG: 6-phosphofructokinase [Akkermansiaceae bacterium]|jgi:6-phosphofructokinase 1|nr:6-phosphofructokinase [Akkermansiaceae bacterium]MDP4645798.1 6-phosphofructokinase [Akkermansiaceae bacterium]MDP4720533.1 6-phosphofructokinase [Akkermansiaceae bacterium]MDP4779029.1 6-phosphofructokinase [Akkermansiaceae bacterium]MDP4847967.1 6-phosphofructokinase [Akkermansiaceae bacterium]